MKKTVITVATVVFAAFVAQAQGFAAADGGVTRDRWTKSMQPVQADSVATDRAFAGYTVSAKQAQNEDRLVKTFTKKMERARLRAARQHFNHLPATGVMRDYAVEGRLVEDHSAAAAAKTNPADKKAEPAKKTATHKKKRSHVYVEGSPWLARVTGVARYQGETTEQWNARLLAQSLK